MSMVRRNVKVVWRSITIDAGAPSVTMVSPLLKPVLSVASSVLGNIYYLPSFVKQTANNRTRTKTYKNVAKVAMPQMYTPTNISESWHLWLMKQTESH